MSIERPMFPPRADNVVVAFTNKSKRRPFVSRPYTRREGNMHTFGFRSREAILEADEGTLARDVGQDLHKAQVKLRKIRERLAGVREFAAAQIETLTAAETKLAAATVEALLSRREG